MLHMGLVYSVTQLDFEYKLKWNKYRFHLKDSYQQSVERALQILNVAPKKLNVE